MTGPESPQDDRRSRRLLTWPRAAGFAIGCLLIAAALWAIFRNKDSLKDAMEAARNAPAYLVALCLLLPIVNWICTTGTLWIFTGRYGKVSFGEMVGLIGSAWLLNLLPLRLGMIGRIAYHSKYHGIKVRQGATVLVQALVCSVVSLAILILWVRVSSAWCPMSAPGNSGGAPMGPLGDSWLQTLTVLLAPLPLCVCALLVTRRWPSMRAKGEAGGPRSNLWRWPAAIMCRYLDMLTWMVRYALVFAVIGRPVPLMQAAIITTSAQAAMLTPMQFGLREWMVGATAAFVGAKSSTPPQEPPQTPLPQSRTESFLGSAAPGLMADVTMRAAELVVILPVGFGSTWWLWRRMKRTGRAAR